MSRKSYLYGEKRPMVASFTLIACKGLLKYNCLSYQQPGFMTVIRLNTYVYMKQILKLEQIQETPKQRPILLIFIGLAKAQITSPNAK